MTIVALIFVVFSVCIVGDFVDSFDEFDKTRWVPENGTFHCSTFSRKRGCAIARPSNLWYTPVTPIMNQKRRNKHMMAMWLRNNCDHNFCCMTGRCTHYTSAFLRSRKLYTYGTYVFLSRAVAANVRHFVKKKYVTLPFDASQDIAVYAIHWEPKRIVWYINDAVAAHVSSDTLIPYGGMFITVGILPIMTDLGFSEDSVAMVIHLYRVTYTRQPSIFDDPKIELFALPLKKNPFVVFIIATLVALLFLLSVLFWWSRIQEKQSVIPYGYEVLNCEPQVSFVHNAQRKTFRIRPQQELHII